MTENNSTTDTAAKKRDFRYTLLVFLFLFSMIVSFLAFKASQLFEYQQQQSQYLQLVNGETSRLQAHLNLILQTIQSQAAYVGALRFMQNETFQSYAKPISQQIGVDNVLWIPKINHIERNSHVRTQQRQGIDNFHLKEINELGQISTRSQRDIYYPINYASKKDIDLQIGLDIASRDIWKKHLLQACDSGKASLVYIDSLQYLDIFQPVYHYGLPTKIAARRANLKGFFGVRLNMTKLLTSINKTLSTHGVNFSLNQQVIIPQNTSVPATQRSFIQELWQVLTRKTNLKTSSLPTTQLSLGDSQWQIKFEIESPHKNYTPRLVLITGILFSLLIVFYALSLMRRTHQVEILVEKRTLALKESEAQLVQSEKMASIGQMVAGIVHEINTPLAYVRSSLEITQTNLNDVNDIINSYEAVINHVAQKADIKQLQISLENALEHREMLEDEENLQESVDMINNSLSGLDKISKLVLNLKNFSRLDRAEYSLHNLHQGLDEALSMVKHMLPQNIKIIKNYDDIPKLMCSPAQINQVFLNFLSNAIHSMEDIKDRDALLTIQTKTNKDMIEIHILDNGYGISIENQQKIYEPFFTTKRSGKGTGLGLAISKKIIHEHHGQINVSSETNQGTHFILSFTINGELT